MTAQEDDALGLEVFVWIGLAALAVAVAVGFGLGRFVGGDGESGILVAPEPAVEGESAFAAEPTAAPEPTAPAPTQAAPESAVTTTLAPAEEVPESRAVIRNGQIFLEGAVPTSEDGEEIARLAGEVLGPDNVFNNYVVDPNADDANLGNVTVEDTVNFESGQAEILPEAEDLLIQGLVLFQIRPNMTMTIVGHTDDIGTDESNFLLSLARADAVKQWFVTRGVDPFRIDVVGKGESEPIADNATDEGRRLNRRIQFLLNNVLG